MSQATSGRIHPPSAYTTSEDRYVRFGEDFLGVEYARVQQNILRTVANNQRTLIWGANGPGKSYATAGLKLAFLYANTDSIVLGTSGSYQQYYDTMWRSLESMFDYGRENHGLPGRSLGGKQPSLELDDEWYCKVISPRSPGELEGRHGSDVLIVIDEADKRYVTEEHFDAAGSSISDLNDKMVAICNPPEDETDVTYQIKNNPRWEVIEISSFQSHNALVDAGKLNRNRIPGITDLITIAGDWEEWNGDPWPLVDQEYPGSWPGMPAIEDQLEEGAITRDKVTSWLAPGFDVARKIHEDRTDLDTRWYIRRAGVIPPEGAEVHRPIYTDDIQQGGVRSLEFGNNRFGIGVDIGRTSDSTTIIEIRKIPDTDTPCLRTRTDIGGERQHQDNEAMIRAAMEESPIFGGVAIDAMGEGSGVADQMDVEYDQAMRFDAGMKPVGAQARKQYKDRRTEAHALLGRFLRDGGKFETGTRLEKELFAAARKIQFNRRRSSGRDVYKATPKEELKEVLGRSPDVLDAAAIAVWCYEDAFEQSIREVEENQRKSIPSSF